MILYHLINYIILRIVKPPYADTSPLWTPSSPTGLFLVGMNILNVNTSIFGTVDTFFRFLCSKKLLESGHLLKFVVPFLFSQIYTCIRALIQ